VLFPQLHTRSYTSWLLFATARHGGVLYLGGLSSWLALPRLDGDLVVGALVAANVAVFLGWQLAPTAMMKHATLGRPASLLHRPWTLLTSFFSHATLPHLFNNMQALLFVGPSLAQRLGAGTFLSLYLASGLAGNLASLAVGAWRERRRAPGGSYSLGASGAVYGALAANAVLSRHRQVRWMGLLLTPAQHMAASLALDVAAPPPGVGVWAHATGASFGALAAVLWRGR